jgi:hypothetical protein
MSMNEVELLQKIHKTQIELEEKKSEDANGEAVATLEKELLKLTEIMMAYEKAEDKQAFMDNCRG